MGRSIITDGTAEGIETGYTKNAQYCLAASAYREDLGGMRLIAVVLGAHTSSLRVRDSRALLKWGFRFFRTELTPARMQPRTQTLVWYSDERTVPVGIAKDHYMTFPFSIRDQLKDVWNLQSELHAPVRQGQEVGTLEIRHDDKVLATLPAIALQDVPEGRLFTRLKDYLALLTR